MRSNKSTTFSSTTTTTTSTIRRMFTFSILFLSVLLFFSTTETLLNDFLLRESSSQTSMQANYTIFSTTSTKYPKWFEPLLMRFNESTNPPNIGIVNMFSEEDRELLEGLHYAHYNVTHVKFDKVSSNTTWRHIYPLWIDEEEKYTKPKCPNIPIVSNIDMYKELDIVVVKISRGNWSQAKRTGIRDVHRLQVSLVAAKLAAESRRKEVFVVVVSGGGCEPMWELFRCDDLIWSKGQYWVYKADVVRLKQKVKLPVGACKVAPQSHYFESEGNKFHESMITRSRKNTKQPAKEAYVTVLHTSELYVCGAIALARSILQTNTTKDLILLADNAISPKSLQGLSEAGWKIKDIQRVRCPSARKGHYNEWNCSKLRIWELTQYSKVIFIDADFIVLKNIDHFFQYPQLSAAEDTMSNFNSGVMVVEPSKCFFNTLMTKRYTLQSYNGGDQGLLNEVFTWWHRITKKISFLKCFMDEIGPREVPKDVYMIHFVGVKPWACYRDYDCNWDIQDRHIFASDQVHRRWWQVYDVLPSSLQQFCGLTTYMDANIKMWREHASKSTNFTDTHWKMNVTDPRQFNLIDQL